MTGGDSQKQEEWNSDNDTAVAGVLISWMIVASVDQSSNYSEIRQPRVILSMEKPRYHQKHAQLHQNSTQKNIYIYI